MSKKFSIVHNPTFVAKVKVPRVGGEPLEVDFTFKYKKRTEFTEIIEKWKKGADELQSVADSDLREATEAEIAYQIEQIKDIVEGWDFEEEFNEENIRELVESSPMVSLAIVSAYQNAHYEARLGN